MILISGSYWDDRAPLVSSVLFVFAVILAGMASFGRLWCSLYIAGYKTEKLITEGPYSMCRNPLYFFSMIGGLGVGLATGTFLIPIIILFAFAAHYPFVIRSEELKLKQLFKDEYENYLHNVPMFFPRLSFLREPEGYMVRPIVFRRHMFDNIWFIWLLGIMQIIEALHKLGILPVIFKLY